jgi:hypothetical protein
VLGVLVQVRPRGAETARLNRPNHRHRR